MGTITGQQILTRQRDLVKDVDAERWTDTEALRWINDGQREAVRIKPTAYATRSAVTLAAGVRQNIGASLTTAHAILDVTTNLDDLGNPTKAITKADLRSLDKFDPAWRTRTGEEIKHWDSVPEDPKAFLVYPAFTGGRVEVQAALAPSDLTTLASPIALDDIYANALGYYLAFRLYSKDEDGAAAPTVAQAYYTLFTNALGA